MTKSEIFKSAHREAKANRINFPSYREAFSAALKNAYNQPKTEEDILFIWVKAMVDFSNGVITSEERFEINSSIRKKYGRVATRNIKNYPKLVAYKAANLA